jgi:hypothetical protein
MVLPYLKRRLKNSEKRGLKTQKREDKKFWKGSLKISEKRALKNHKIQDVKANHLKIFSDF